MRQVERGREVTHRRLAVRQHRQIVMRGDEADDR